MRASGCQSHTRGSSYGAEQRLDKAGADRLAHAVAGVVRQGKEALDVPAHKPHRLANTDS